MVNPVPIVPSQRQRGGKWTPEEEVYAEYLTSLFMQGLLPDCDIHVTLRAYLAKKLNCKPMRVTKKFSVGTYDGKMMYTPSGSVLPNMHTLAMIRQKYLQSLTQPKTKRSHKKKEAPWVWDEQASDYGTATSGTSSGEQQDQSDYQSSRGPVEYYQSENNNLSGKLSPEGIEILRDVMLR